MTTSEPSEVDAGEIGQKVARNAGWNYLSFGIGKALNLLTISILAHILAPSNFGLIALATLAIDYLSILSDFGLGMALVQRREKLEEASNLAFSYNLLIGIALSGIVFLLAPFAAVFFKEAALTSVLRWLGFTFLINSFGSIHKALLQRDLKFGKKLVPELGNTLLKGTLSIMLAFMGYGVWSLVWGQLAGVSISSILLWFVIPWRPKLQFQSPITNELFGYGFSIMADRAATTIADSFDYVLIGRLYDTAALGIYTLAYRLPDLLIINTLAVLAAVFFPAFSSIQSQPTILRKSFLSTLRYVQLLVTPLCLGLLVAADPIIRVFFGPQWVGAIPIMQVLSVYALVLSVGFHVGDVYKAIGRPDILMKLAIPVLVIRLVCLWIGAQYSLLGIAFGHLAASTIELILRTIVTSKIMQISIGDLTKQLTAFLGAVALIACALPAQYLTQGLSPLSRLFFIALAGAFGYLIVIWFLEQHTIRQALDLLGLRKKQLSVPN